MLKAGEESVNKNDDKRQYGQESSFSETMAVGQAIKWAEG